jgi:transposase
MAAVTQVRYLHSPGRAYFDRKVAEGKTRREALRALKRRISDVIYARLRADAADGPAGPGGQQGNGSDSSAASSHPQSPALRTSHSRTHANPTSQTWQAQPPPDAPRARTTP